MDAKQLHHFVKTIGEEILQLGVSGFRERIQLIKDRIASNKSYDPVVICKCLQLLFRTTFVPDQATRIQFSDPILSLMHLVSLSFVCGGYKLV